ncbi:alpha/beta hydrolase family protein [Paenibacillus sp. J5C_2022]|uniref:alpha/beta hydrolase family protein n=1 Tax=Paenibacillus sp. J5C2022 TaxID=2977129 RepID=UPI0021D108D8|nr:alpha/beta hydrolase family protein [Paenibacillus sp. J5C2022]MCU6707534.1 alpha/beta hydrolase family protein [Paenibacillus sp. J5C2022]
MRFFSANQYVDRHYMGEREFHYRKALEDGNWSDWQQRFRQRLREITGLEQLAKETEELPLEAEIVQTVQMDGYTREKGYLQTEPGLSIPFYLLLPSGGEGPYPLVLTPHGHSRRGKEIYVGNYETEQERSEGVGGDRDIALQAVKEGFAAIAMDVRGFWEMGREEEYAQGKGSSCDPLQKRALMFGRTLIGERVHDMGRVIDYASTRPEIDSSRIVITGNSGGGTVSLFTAALDERIDICIPGSYFCTYRASLLAMHHCDCNFIPGLLQQGEMYDIVGLVAPRPFLAVNGEKDEIYPSFGAREAYEHVERIYAAMGAADRCAIHFGDGGHRYYKEPVWPFVKQQLERLK